MLVAALAWLGGINILLAVFNVIPAAPLDGGRLLRAVLWAITKDKLKSEIWSARSGQVFGWTLAIIGIYLVLALRDYSWIWFILLGWFLISAASAENQQAMLQSRLRAVPVRQVMTPRPVTVPASTTVAEFLASYPSRYRHSAFPVMAGDQPVGLVTVHRASQVHAAERDRTTVRDVACALSGGAQSEVAQATPDESVADLLPRLGGCSEGWALVLDGGHLAGIVSPADISDALQRLTRRSNVLAMPAPLRIGLAGYGLGGRYFHAPLIASAANCEFLGVVTTSPERRREVAADLGLPAFDDLAGLAHAGAEAVAISTPAATHVTLTRQALRLGLAVVCDKPFALDAESARATVELAEQLGVPLTVYQNRRWDSDFLTLRELLRQGRLGTLITVESRFERFRPQSGPGPAGGGVLTDFGSHLADQALVLAGPVRGVYAEMHYRAEPDGLDDDVFVALTHDGGVHTHLWGSYRQGAPGPRFRAAGTEGAFFIQDVDGQEARLRAGQSPASVASSGGQWGAEPPERWGRLMRGDAGEPVPSERGAWNVFYPAFADAVRGAGPMPVNPWDAVATATVLDAARLSARTAQVVTLAE